MTATRSMRAIATGLVTGALVTACASVDPTPAVPTATPHPTSIPTMSPSPSPEPTPHLTLADAEDCPVTQPVLAPPEVGNLFGREMATGNADLWAGGLGNNGILAIPESHAERYGLGAKIGWWRHVPGSVVISGRRLDGPAPPISGQGSDGYGRTGFQGSGVGFPTEGYWEITGSIGESELTFVMFVHVEA